MGKSTKIADNSRNDSTQDPTARGERATANINIAFNNHPALTGTCHNSRSQRLPFGALAALAAVASAALAVAATALVLSDAARSARPTVETTAIQTRTRGCVALEMVPRQARRRDMAVAFRVLQV